MFAEIEPRPVLPLVLPVPLLPRYVLPPAAAACPCPALSGALPCPPALLGGGCAALGLAVRRRRPGLRCRWGGLQGVRWGLLCPRPRPRLPRCYLGVLRVSAGRLPQGGTPMGGMC
jgi:hypothetical protein